MWAAALRYLIVIAERLGLAISIVGGIENLLNQATPNPQTQQIITEEELILTAVGDLGARVTALSDQDVIDHAALVALIAGVASAISPVTLPTTPPAGYGGASTSDIADQVWNGAIATIPSTPGDALLQVARSLNVTSLYDMPLYVGIFRVSRIDWSAPGIYQSGVGYPTFDPTGVLVSDTLLSCLTRQNPDWTCGNPWGPQSYVGLDWNGVSSSHYTTIIDEAGFSTLKESLGLLPPSLLAPVWPGSALATLGTSVALDRTVTLTEAMDGVIVTLTSVPPDKPKYVLGALTATAHIGQIAFIADNGAAEYPQNLSFASEIYVPLALVGASAAVLRTVPGVAGTVQAWTRTP